MQSGNAVVVAGDPAIRETELNQLFSDIVELTHHHLRRMPSDTEEVRGVCGEWVDKFFQLGGRGLLNAEMWPQ